MSSAKLNWGVLRHGIPTSVKHRILQDGFEINLQDCCSVNTTYCRRFGNQCGCQQDDSGCKCVCPSALDYTVRLAAAIAIILLIGVSIMLAISVYRRATLSRARRQLSTSQSASETSRAPDPPPNYDDIYFISYPRTNPEAVDFEKLPTYDEALTLPSLQNSDSAKSEECKMDAESRSGKQQLSETTSTSESNEVAAQANENSPVTSSSSSSSENSTNATGKSSNVMMPSTHEAEATDL